MVSRIKAWISCPITHWAIAAGLWAWLLFTVGFLDFRHYQPDRGTSTIYQLVEELPKTYKFAVVEQGGRSYLVWIGKSRGVTVSGPPVYVFNSTGDAHLSRVRFW